MARLKALAAADQIFIAQEIDPVAMVEGLTPEHKYIIKNLKGQQILVAKERSNIIVRNFCGRNRPFHIRVVDNSNNKVLCFKRRLAFTGCWFPWYRQRLQVFNARGVLLGSVKQKWTVLRPVYLVRNADDITVYMIRGTLFYLCDYFHNIKFKIYDKCKNVVGSIKKKWGGIFREACNDTDIFSVTFPKCMDVKMKAVMLGACILIDMMYYENGSIHLS